MPEALKLDHRGPFTFESALRKDADTTSKAAYFAAAEELSQVLWDSRRTIAALVEHYLGLCDGSAYAVEPRTDGSWTVSKCACP